MILLVETRGTGGWRAGGDCKGVRRVSEGRAQRRDAIHKRGCRRKKVELASELQARRASEECQKNPPREGSAGWVRDAEWWTREPLVEGTVTQGRRPEAWGSACMRNGM